VLTSQQKTTTYSFTVDYNKGALFVTASKNQCVMKAQQKALSALRRMISRPQLVIKLHVVFYTIHKIIFQLYGI
jgi:hypothetical protein